MFPRGLPRERDAVSTGRFLRTVATVVVGMLLTLLVPGLVTRSESLSDVTGQPDTTTSVRVARLSERRRPLGWLFDHLTSRLYLVSYGVDPASQAALTIDGETYRLIHPPSQTFGFLVKDSASGSKPSAKLGYLENRISSGRTIAVLQVDAASAEEWILDGTSYRAPTVGVGEVEDLQTPLGSGQWSGRTLLLGGALLMVLGYILSGRTLEKYLLSTLSALLVIVGGLNWAARVTAEFIGQRAADPRYPIALAAGMPIAVALAVVAAGILVGRTASRLIGGASATTPTILTWGFAKVLCAVCLPLVIFIEVRSVDTFLFALSPGMHL